MTVSSEHLSEEQLLLQLEEARKKVEIGALYAHYRDPKNPYRVINVAIIEATQEPGVVYQKEFGSNSLKSVVWIRSLSSWLEKVDVDGVLVPRFCRYI